MVLDGGVCRGREFLWVGVGALGAMAGLRLHRRIWGCLGGRRRADLEGCYFGRGG